MITYPLDGSVIHPRESWPNWQKGFFPRLLSPRSPNASREYQGAPKSGPFLCHKCYVIKCIRLANSDCNSHCKLRFPQKWLSDNWEKGKWCWWWVYWHRTELMCTTYSATKSLLSPRRQLQRLQNFQLQLYRASVPHLVWSVYNAVLRLWKFHGKQFFLLIKIPQN